MGSRLKGLFWEMLPPVLFIFIPLMLIFVVLKLLALQYEIRFYAFARAAIGALVLGKVILLMQMAERKSAASRYPRAIVVAFKTVIYAMAVFLFEFGERVARAWYARGNLGRSRDGEGERQPRSLPCAAHISLHDYRDVSGNGGDQSRNGRGGANPFVLQAPRHGVSVGALGVPFFAGTLTSRIRSIGISNRDNTLIAR
jgi:hypothetical protein